LTRIGGQDIEQHRAARRLARQARPRRDEVAQQHPHIGQTCRAHCAFSGGDHVWFEVRGEHRAIRADGGSDRERAIPAAEFHNVGRRVVEL
jgi:hypothetical protein